MFIPSTSTAVTGTRFPENGSLSNSGVSYMNRSTGLICGILLVVCTSTVLAQHQGSQGGTGHGSGRTSNSDDLRDFKRAMALQASPDQVSQFKQLATSTHAAKKATQELLQLSANSSNHDFSHSAGTLPSAV